VHAFQPTSKTPILSVHVADKERAVANVKDLFKDYQQDTLDGISVYGDDFWLNMRGSNTENKIRYTVEADTPEKMEELQTLLANTL
jgi:phosphomannomutase